MVWNFTRSEVGGILDQARDEATNGDDYLAYCILGWSRNSSGGDGDVAVTMAMTYVADYSQELQVNQRVGEILSTLITADMNPEEKEKEIHDWIVANVEYDTNQAERSAYSALFLGKTVCQGYALLTYKMLDQVGVPARIVNSSAMNHAWNMVNLCGNWYHLDATWDDPVPDVPGRILYTYYNLSDSEIAQGSNPHYGWLDDVPDAPEAPLSYVEGVCEGLEGDSYEPNNDETTSSLLTLSSGDAAAAKTSGASIHTSTDLDYYRIELDPGDNYTVSARVHDSYSSGDGQNYTCDVKFSYKSGGTWSMAQDTSHSPFSVENEGEVIFMVEPYYSGETGTYALEIEVTKGITESIDWVASKSEAMSQALAQGKLVLLLAGRAICSNTRYMKETVCESTDPPIRTTILDSYVPWYCDVDSSTEHRTYTGGFSSYTLPLICRIDPDNPDQYLDRSTGIQDTGAFYERLLSDIVAKGDVNHLNGVTLEDAILSLQVVAGIQTATVYTDADVDGDEYISIIEAIYVLQKISNLR